MVEAVVKDGILEFKANTMSKKMFDQTYMVRDTASLWSKEVKFIGYTLNPTFFIGTNECNDLVRVPMYEAQKWAPRTECPSYDLAIEWVKKQKEKLPHIYIK